MAQSHLGQKSEYHVNKGTVLYVYEFDKSDNDPPGDSNSKVTGDWTSIIFGGAVNNGAKLLNSVKVYCIKLSNLRGNFIRGEIIAKSSDGNTDDMPIVTGSLSDIDITFGLNSSTCSNNFL